MVLSVQYTRREAKAALREANDTLKRSNADLLQFAYSASHDLKEPLRMGATYSELLRRDRRTVRTNRTNTSGI
jgi:light-regulated signal transduction histidine kinase (bacteriophytochrome)